MQQPNVIGRVGLHNLWNCISFWWDFESKSSGKGVLFFIASLNSNYVRFCGHSLCLLKKKKWASDCSGCVSTPGLAQCKVKQLLANLCQELPRINLSVSRGSMGFSSVPGITRMFPAVGCWSCSAAGHLGGWGPVWSQVLSAVSRITRSNCLLLNELAGVTLVFSISLSQAPFLCTAWSGWTLGPVLVCKSCLKQQPGSSFQAFYGPGLYSSVKCSSQANSQPRRNLWKDGNWGSLSALLLPAEGSLCERRADSHCFK